MSKNMTESLPFSPNGSGKKKQRSTANGTARVLASVAKKATVSVGTVSRVFNNSPLISATTRERVLAAARDLGFRPRVGVRAPQIALVTEPPQNSLMGGYVSTLTQYLCYALSLANAHIAIITEDRPGMLSDNRYDGVIGIAWRPETLNLLKTFRRTPIVWFSDDMKDFFHTVYMDNEAAGRMVGKYLRERGHKRIAVIHDPDYCGEVRTASLTAAVNDGSALTQVLPIANDIPLQLAVKQLIDAECTAVWVTGEDLKVLEVNWLLQELAGKKVPADISLVGFENPGISEFQRPALTTIASPLYEMAEKAVSIILDSQAHKLLTVKLPPRLIERNSVAALKD